MDTTVIVFLVALSAVAYAKDLDDDLTQIFQNQQEEEEQVQPNSVQRDPAGQSDLPQVFHSEQEEEQVEKVSDLTQIWENGEEEVQRNSVEQESEAATDDDASQCGFSRGRRCLLPITTFVITNKDDNKEACEALRLLYNCMKDMSDSCLQDREWIQRSLKQMKSSMDDNCDFDNKEKFEEKKCISSLTLELKDCVHQGLIQTLSNFKKTAKNNIARFRCMSYDVIVDCQTDKIRAKCGKETADHFYDYMADMPDVIQEACDVVNGQ